MTNLKIFKVKVLNVPKDKELTKIINLSSKKTYYFSEFNEKLKLIKESSERNNKKYSFDIEIVDYDAPNIVHFVLTNYVVNKNTPDSIKAIVEYEALKDKNAEEKGVSDDYKKQFFGALQESEDYDVASNESVKNGSLKKTGILSKLIPFSTKEKENVIDIDNEEKEELEEYKADMLASAKSDELHKDSEIVNLSDSQKEHEDTEDTDNVLENSKNEIKEIDNEGHEEENTHLNDSVNEPENEINLDNEIEIYTTKNKKHEVVDEEMQEKLKISDVLEKDISSQMIKIEAPELNLEKPDLQNLDEIEREETVFLNKREEEKKNYIENQVNALEQSLKERYYNGLNDIEKNIATYYEENKPNYDEYIDNLINEQAPLNKEIINTLDKQLEEEDNLLLKKELDAFKQQQEAKKLMLKEKRELRIAEKRKELNEDIEKLKERGKSDLNNDLKEKADSYKEQQIKELENDILKTKASLEKELNYNLIKYDSETFKNLSLLRVEIVKNKNKSDELKLQKESNDNERKQLKLEEERINLELKQAEAEISKANAVKDAKVKSDNDLERTKHEALAKKHELELKQEENRLRKINAEEEANRLKQQELELRQSELDIYKKEEEQMNKLIKSNYLNQIVPKNNQQEAFNVTAPSNDIEKNNDNKLGKLLAGALILSSVVGTGYVVAENNGYLDDNKSNDNKTDKTVDDKHKTYNMLIKNSDFVDAYKIDPTKKEVIKEQALEQKDYIDAVELAKITNDKEYLIRVYLANKNSEDLYKTYKNMSFEEKSEITQNDLEMMVNLYIDKDEKNYAKDIINDVKDEQLKKVLEEKLK